jgi:hypothetical protein
MSTEMKSRHGGGNVKRLITILARKASRRGSSVAIAALGNLWATAI